MIKKISFSIIAIIVVMIFVRYLLANVSTNEISIADRVTIYLQALAGSVTACISIWGLSIAYRQIKHWEMKQCDKLKKEYINLVDEYNNRMDKVNNKSTSIEDPEIKEIINNTLNLWENIARLEKFNFLDQFTLYDIFYTSLLGNIKHKDFQSFIDSWYKKNPHMLCHTRELYNKWYDRHKKDIKDKNLEKSYKTMKKNVQEALEQESIKFQNEQKIQWERDENISKPHNNN